MDDTVTISRAVLDAIVADAAASREEICGLLLGREDGAIDARVAGRNVDPTPATRFEIDPAVVIAAHRAARAGGPAVRGHYHSHPSGSPIPSATDAAGAAPDGAIWLIVARTEARAWRAVRDGAVQGRFDPVTIASA